MIRSFLFTTITLIVAVYSSAKAKGENMNELAGNWKCVSAVNDGKQVADETVKQLALTVTKEGGYKTTLGDQILFDSTCKIDGKKKPKQIDMIGTEGENKGKAALGIYKIVEGKLTICYTMPGKDRPSTFESEPDSGATLVVWQRKKE